MITKADPTRIHPIKHTAYPKPGVGKIAYQGRDPCPYPFGCEFQTAWCPMVSNSNEWGRIGAEEDDFRSRKGVARERTRGCQPVW